MMNNNVILVIPICELSSHEFYSFTSGRTLAFGGGGHKTPQVDKIAIDHLKLSFSWECILKNFYNL